MGSNTISSVEKTKAILEKYISIYVHSLRIDSILEFDLYMYTPAGMVLYRASHLPFTDKSRTAILANDTGRLYIESGHRRQYQKYIRGNIETILADPTVDDFTKASLVYDSSKELIKDIFKDPTLAENVQEGQAMVESTVLYILSGSNAFHNMLRVMAFDYSIYSHSVNVCTFSLAIAQALGIDSTQELVELGTGALLLDVGMTKIPDSIRYKPGPLEKSEIETVQKHPNWGVELIAETNLIPEASYLPIRQHHERQNKTGYPGGLGLDDIHIYSKIVAVADVFDAMTTERVYRRAAGTFSTFKTMFADREAFDQTILRQFAELMGPSQLSGI